MVLKQTYNETSLKMLHVHVCRVLSITFHTVPFEDMGIIAILYYGKLGFGFEPCSPGGHGILYITEDDPYAPDSSDSVSLIFFKVVFEEALSF